MKIPLSPLIALFPPFPISPTSPRHSSYPGVDLLYSALLVAGGSRAGGPPGILYLTVTSPPPILMPFNPYTTTLSSYIHQNWPLIVKEVHPFPDLSVHRLGVGGRNFHVVLHPHPGLVVVDTVKPQDTKITLLFI